MRVFSIKRLFFVLTVLFSLNVGFLSTDAGLVYAADSSDQNSILEEEISTTNNTIEKDGLPSSDTDPIISYSVPVDGSAYTLRAGDIFTTSSTSSSLIGHSGIAISSTYILHIPGPSKTTERITLSEWKKRYSGGTTWVHRSPNSTVASQAANWAIKNYYSSGGYYGVQDKKPYYSINSNTIGTNPTYCSKIVWQSFYYGTGSTPVIGSGSGTTILPYSIRDGKYFNSSYKPYLITQW